MMNTEQRYLRNRRKWLVSLSNFNKKSMIMAILAYLIALNANSKKSKMHTIADLPRLLISSSRRPKRSMSRCSNTWTWWKGDTLCQVAVMIAWLISTTTTVIHRLWCMSSSMWRSWRSKVKLLTCRMWFNKDKKSLTTSNNSWLISMTLPKRLTPRSTIRELIWSKLMLMPEQLSIMQKRLNRTSRRPRSIRSPAVDACTGQLVSSW